MQEPFPCSGKRIISSIVKPARRQDFHFRMLFRMDQRPTSGRTWQYQRVYLTDDARRIQQANRAVYAARR